LVLTPPSIFDNKSFWAYNRILNSQDKETK